MQTTSPRCPGRLRWALHALAVLLVLPGGLRAQNVPPALTLNDALELARHHNPDLRLSENELHRAAAEERRGWGAFLPRLSMGVSMSEFSSRTMTARDEFGQPVTLDDPAEFSATSASGGLDASIMLFDGFRRINDVRAARSGSRAAAALDDAESIRIEAEVRRRFYASMGAVRLIEVEERLLAAAEERLDATQAMVDAGRAAPQDVLGAEVDLARQRMALEDAKGDAHVAALLLLEAMGVAGEPAFVVDGEFPDHVDPAGLNAVPLVNAALASSPRVRRADATAERAGHAADAANAARWPTISLGASITREISLPDRDQLTTFPWNRGTAVGLRASFPLFTGFQASEQITGARLDRIDMEENLRRTRLAVEREVRTSLTAARRAYISLLLAEEVVGLSQHRLESGQEGFRHGLIGFTELQQLIEQAAQAERAEVRARVEYARAVATLEEAVGDDDVFGKDDGEPR